MLKTPDVTPVQAVAIGTAVLDVIVQFGWHITERQHDALLTLMGVLAAALLADAHVRNGRARGNTHR